MIKHGMCKIDEVYSAIISFSLMSGKWSLAKHILRVIPQFMCFVFGTPYSGPP